MANWNLSVELTGQGTRLVQTLRTSAQAARTLERQVAAARREIEQLERTARGADRVIRIRVDADTTRIRRQLDTAIQQASRGRRAAIPFTADTRSLATELRRAVRQAAQGQRITLPAGVDAQALRRTLERAIRAASRGQRIVIPADIDTRGLRRSARNAVRDLSRDLNMQVSAEVDIDTDSLSRGGLRLLNGIGDSISGVTDAAGRAGNTVGQMSSRMSAAAGVVAPLMGVAAALSAIALASPAVATAAATTLPVAFTALGAAALKSDREVTTAFADLKSTLTSTFVDAAQPIKPYLIDGMTQLAAAARNLQDPLSRMFAAAGPSIEPMVDGLTRMATNALPGVEAALGRTGPMMEAVADAAAQIGTAIGDALDAMTAGNEEELAAVWEAVGDGVSQLIQVLGEGLGDLLANESAVDSLALTFTILAEALEAAFKAADAFAPVMEALLTAIAGIVGTNDWLFDLFGDSDEAVAGAEEAAAALDSYGESADEARDSTDLFGAAAERTQAQLEAEKKAADGLRESILALNDVNRSALDAQSAFEAAIDDAAETARENAGALDMVNGQLDLNSEKARSNYDALSELAASTGEAAAAARDNGASWAEVNDIYSRGREQFISLAQAMGLTKDEATALADQLLQPLNLQVDSNSEAVIAELQRLQDKLASVPPGKTITVKAPTAEAVAALEAAGYSVDKIPGSKNVKITAPTGSAVSAAIALRNAINALRDKSITVRTHYVVTGDTARTPRGQGSQLKYARGGVVDYYADGGIQRGGVRYFAGGAEQHIAQIAPAGSWRVWAEPETGGEAYIPLAPGKRSRSRAIAEETVRRLGGAPVQWFADGGVTDWTYDPDTGSLYSPSDSGRAAHKTRKVKVKGKTKEVEYFDLAALEKDLKKSAKATADWNKNLALVADRAGSDVAEALASMGEDGIKLTAKMAKGSKKYIDEMAKALRGLAAEAKASLTDYTRQLTKATTTDATFAKNLATLAGRGYGDLAKQLAAQGDQAAQELAAAAVKDNKKASSANKAAKTANNALTDEQVQQLVAIIAAVTSKNTGIHQVAATTGLGEDEIIDVAGKAKGQIKSALGARADRLLADLAKASRGMAYANGGIREGIYATRGGIVRFAEPSTQGEAYIPLAATKRAGALRVLGDVASRFGVGLTDAGAAARARVVVIREQGPLVGAQHWHINGNRSDMALAREIDARHGYQLRRLARGGVGTR